MFPQQRTSKFENAPYYHAILSCQIQLEKFKKVKKNTLKEFLVKTCFYSITEYINSSILLI